MVALAEIRFTCHRLNALRYFLDNSFHRDMHYWLVWVWNELTIKVVFVLMLVVNILRVNSTYGHSATLNRVLSEFHGGSWLRHLFD